MDEEAASPASEDKKKSVSIPKNTAKAKTSKSSSKKARSSSKKKKPAAADDNHDDSNTLPKPSAAASATASGAKAKKTPSPNSKKKPTMTEMAHDAIVAMGDRTGSSQIAIARYIVSNYDMEDGRPFRSRLNLALKSATKSQRFKKIRNSYKIDAAYVRKQREKKRKQNKKQSEAEKKKTDQEKKVAEETRLKELEATMTEEELKMLREKQAKEREAQKRKQEVEKLAKERAERIRKRRFPMEDTKLHAEDKELGVKPPEDVTRRPALPYFFHATLPLDDPRRKGKTPSSILAPSRCDTLEYGSRGLVPDLLQVYHFFRGDVHFTLEEESLVPEFGLKHLMFAVDEVLNGNAKRSRLVPPLISHLFVTCLKLLTMDSPVMEDESSHERRLRKDLSKLAVALSPASWGEVCALYMDAMERYYTSSASVDPNVFPSGMIDIQYLMRATDVAEPMTPAPQRMGDEAQADIIALPDGYCAYLGNPHGSLAMAHSKLLKLDPWNLKAEELMALLRALTDDILSSRPEIAEDLARR